MEYKHEKYQRLIARCQTLEPMQCGVVHPCDESALRGAVDAARQSLLTPVLIGPEQKIRAVAAHCELDMSAEIAVRLAGEGAVDALMKGSLHTDELMGAVVKRETGLRTERRISHCFVMDVPALEQPLIISDAAVNIFPTLQDKVHIIQNAIDLAHALGRTLPKVAILSAIETVNPSMPTTVEAGALCKMADRGQITGGRRASHHARWLLCSLAGGGNSLQRHSYDARRDPRAE
jgi:phosphate acetyltransferase